MASNARSAKAMTEMIGDILAMMNKTPSNDMFGEAVTPITAEESIRETLRAIDAYNQQRNQTPRPSGDLLDSPQHGMTTEQRQAFRDIVMAAQLKAQQTKD